MLQGRTYLCKKLDLHSKMAIVKPVDVKYYTSIRDHVDINVVGGSAAYPTPQVLQTYLWTCLVSVKASDLNTPRCQIMAMQDRCLLTTWSASGGRLFGSCPYF